MVTLDRETWARIFPYLDQSHDIPEEQLEDWLAKVTAEHPDIGPPLRAALTLRFHDDSEPNFLEQPFVFPPPPRSLIGERIGAYTIESLLGKGGMGEVWLARRSDGHFKGLFAVKFLDPASRAPVALDRFKREGRLLARLTHPNIARLIDAGVMPDERPYLILEYVKGEHIDQFCQARSLSLEERIRLFLNVTAAVANAHTNLVVHRDIKPSNVLVTPEGEVKLLDFGVAKLIGNDLADEDQTHATRVEDVALTPDYAAPEQILGDPPSTATDVYQLGVLLYVLLVGTLPNGGAKRSRADHIRAALDEIPAKMSEAAPPAWRKTLRGDLDAIVAKALRKRPDERYATAAALAADLERYTAHEPVRAREGALTYFAAKFIRRHRGAVAGSIVAILALIAVASFAFLQMRVAQHQRDQMHVLQRRAEAENKFLTQVMSTIGSDSQPVTPKQILEKGIELLDHQYSNDPDFRIDVLVRMAVGFLNVGDENKGYAALIKAEALARPLHSVRAIAEIDCTAVEPEISTGHLDRAIARLAEGEDALSRVAQPTATDRVRCLNGRARVLQAQLKSAAATQTMLQALDLMEKSGETQDLAYADILSNLHISYAELGDTRASYEMAMRLVDNLHRNGWGESEIGLYGRHTLAVALALMGEITAAYAEEKPTVAKLQSGTSDGLIEASIAYQYGWLLWRLGHSDEARKATDDAIRAAHRDGDIQTEIECRISQTRILTALGRWEDAAAEVAQTRDLIAHAPTANGRSATFLQMAEASLARARGQLDEARQKQDAVTRKLSEAGSSQATYLGFALQESARIALAQKRYADAARDAEKSVGLMQLRARKPEFSANVGESLLLLARAQSGDGDSDNARRTSSQAFDALQSGLGSDHPLTREAASMR
jgi:tetratricopeptide (TPR) repeat protein